MVEWLKQWSLTSKCEALSSNLTTAPPKKRSTCGSGRGSLQRVKGCFSYLELLREKEKGLWFLMNVRGNRKISAWASLGSCLRGKRSEKLSMKQEERETGRHRIKDG
jgi:hypothetical protein